MSPYEPALGLHRHRCPRCRLVWEHANQSRDDARPHPCPFCGHKLPGAMSWYKGPLWPGHGGATGRVA